MVLASCSCVVEFSATKNCFAKLKCSEMETTGNAINLKCQRELGGQTFFVSAFVQKTSGFESPTLVLNGLFAWKLGLQLGDSVVVEQVEGGAVSTSVHVVPLSSDDWEIVHLNAEYIEDNLLSQLRLLFVGMNFPVWINNSVCLFLAVESIEPAGALEDFVRLTEDTEVIVSAVGSAKPAPKPLASAQNLVNENSNAPDEHHFSSTENSTAAKDKDSWAEKLSSLFSGGSVPTRNTKNNNDNISGQEPVVSPEKSTMLQEFLATDENFEDADFKLCLRVQPWPDELSALVLSCSCCQCSLFKQPFLAFMLQSDYWDAVEAQQRNYGVSKLRKPLGSFIAKMILLTEKKSAKSREKNKPSENTSAVKASTQLHSSAVISSSESSVRTSTFLRIVMPDSDINLLKAGTPVCSQYVKIVAHIRQNLLAKHILLMENVRATLRIAYCSWISVHIAKDSSCKPAKSLIVSYLPKHGMEEKQLLQLARDYVSYSSSCERWPLVFSNPALVKLPLYTGLTDVKDRDEVQGFDCIVADGMASCSTDTVCYTNSVLLLSVNFKCSSLGEDSLTKFPAALCDRMKVLLDFTANNSLPLQKDSGGLGKIQYLDIGNLRKECIEYASCCTGTHACSHVVGHVNGHLLLLGELGSGKSTLADAISEELWKWPYCVFSIKQDCKTLKGKQFESLSKKFASLFEEAMEKEPSIVILDNLDELCCQGTNLESLIPGAEFTFERITQVVKTWLDRLAVEKHQIMVLATTKSVDHLNKELLRSSGKQYFRKIVAISPPNADQRKEVLLGLLSEEAVVDYADTVEHLREKELENILKLTESFNVLDLKIITQRAVAAAFARTGSCPFVLSGQDFCEVLSSYTPIHLQNANLDSLLADTDVGLDSIGGLGAVKKSLSEMLLLPAKYPAFFDNLPIRLPQGALLYGFPGTGKTLLCVAMAKECQMNLITVKGPELLSKYIGSSEQAVRDTFDRARKANPCLVFFDEFDALAPRRGHDSTGVTDRVVNQLLTELDGVKGLDGVFVLASTSRPELIDPALLRPGRIDKLLFCDLPSPKDRVDIFKCLSSSMSIDSSVDWNLIAEKTLEFSGADLKAVLCNAQLIAIRELYPYIRNDRPKPLTFGDGNSAKPELINAVVFPSLTENPQQVFATDRNQIESIFCNADLSHLFCSLPGISEAFSFGDFQVGPQKTVEPVIVLQRHLVAALADTKPSLSNSERARFSLVFEEFRNSLKTHATPAYVKPDQRATLS